MACGNILQDCPKTDSPAGAPIFFLFLPPNSVGFMDRGEGIYHILALTAVAIWGTTFVSTKLLLAEGMTPAEIMFYRFLIAYLALKLYKPTFRLPESWRDEALFAAAGLTGGSLYFLTENMALQITLASNVALLLATAPILTVLLFETMARPQRANRTPACRRIGSGARRCRARRLQRELHSEDTACGRSAHAGCRTDMGAL